MLIDSYLRRMRWLHRNQAVSVINAYGEAMRRGKKEAPTKIDASSMWAMLGVKNM